MSNMEDKNKRNMNPAGENRQFNPDPILQARDDSSKSNDGMQPTEIMPIAKKPVSVVDATLLPNQFMGMGSRQSAPSATDMLMSILRFKWTMLIVSILVAVPMIAIIWTQLVPKYQAKAQVRVRPIIPYLVFKTEDSGRIPLYSSFVNTQVAIIRSSVVLQRALEMKEVKETQWYKNPPKSLQQKLLGNPPYLPIERLAENISVRPRKETELIDVSFIDFRANDARIILGAVLDKYLKYIGEKTNADQDKLYSQLTDQYKLLQNQIQGQEATSARLRESLGTQDPMELVSSKRARLDETQARLSELQQRIFILEWEINQANINDSNEVDRGIIEKQLKYYEDAEWRRLDVDVRTIRHNIDNSIRTPKHPDAVRDANDLKFAQDELKRREEQLDEQWRDRPKNAVGAHITVADASDPNYVKGMFEHQLARAKQEEQLLSEEYNKQEAEFTKLFSDAQLLEKENNSLMQMRELFNAVRQRIDQKNMERNVSAGSIEVSTKAYASSRPYNDRRIVFTAMSLVLGIGLGGGLAFLRANRNQAIYTSRDMPYPMQAPLLGYIPVTRITKSRGKSLYDEITRSRSHLIESVRIVRTALLSRLNGNGSTTLLITSANAGTGKSAFTMMLGKSLAQAGKKVLMIDSDFHKMSLTKQFELSDKSGLMESLSGKSTDKRKQYVFPTETSGLSVMPAGKRADDGEVFEQTANGVFKAFISQLRKQYNIILLDSPPILPVADAAILAGQVDGTIIVERELVSRRTNIMDALARLDSAGGRVLGTVFIGTSENEKYGYGYHYGKTKQS